MKCTEADLSLQTGTQVVKSYGWQPLEFLHCWELVWIQCGYPVPLITVSYEASWLNLQCFPSTCTHQGHWMASCLNFRLLLQITSSFCTTSFKQMKSITTRGEVCCDPSLYSCLGCWDSQFSATDCLALRFGSVCVVSVTLGDWLVTFPVSSFKLKSYTISFLANFFVYRSLGFNLDLGKILCVCFSAVHTRGDWQFPRFSEAISLVLRGRERIVWRRKETKNSTLCHVWWLVCSDTLYWHGRGRERPQGTSIFTVRLCGLLVFMSEFSREHALCSPKFQRFLLWPVPVPETGSITEVTKHVQFCPLAVTSLSLCKGAGTGAVSAVWLNRTV